MNRRSWRGGRGEAQLGRTVLPAVDLDSKKELRPLFFTDVLEPNDVDCVLLIGTGFPQDQAAEAELVAGVPFLELSLVNQADFNALVNEFFATDRYSVAKGLVEVIQ